MSFIIAQKNDKVLINNIKRYFDIQSNIRSIKNNIWLIETYRKSTLNNIIHHCINYPLLGEKIVSLRKFEKKVL